MKECIVRLVNGPEIKRLIKTRGSYLVYRKFDENLSLVVVKKPTYWEDMNTEFIKPDDLVCVTDQDDIDIDSFIDEALAYTMSKMPPRLFSAQRIEDKDLLLSGRFMDADYLYDYRFAIFGIELGKKGARLTHTGWFGGAVALFYPGVAKRLSSLMQGDFFATFPSLNEVRIHPTYTTNAYEVHEAIRSWNAARDKSLLYKSITNSVYRYCASRQEFQEVAYPDW